MKRLICLSIGFGILSCSSAVAQDSPLNSLFHMPLDDLQYTSDYLPGTVDHEVKMITHTDLAYANISDVEPNLLSLDIYRPETTQRLPLVIYIHGGGWSKGDKSQIDYKPALFTDQGYALASINYRLSPDPADLDDPNAVRFPVHYQDTACAIRWLVDHADTYMIDPNRFGLIGHSAGAHIVTLVATDATYLNDVNLPLDTIKATVSLDAGGLDIPFYMSQASSKLTSMYVNAFTADPNTWIVASPINHIAPEKGIGAMFLIHQNTDIRLQIHQDFIDSLDIYEIPYKQLITDGYSHGDINTQVGAPDDTQITEPILEFYDQYLKSIPEGVSDYVSH